MLKKPKALKKAVKQAPITKEQRAEIERQREFVREKFYPFLLKNTTSIKDAKIFLDVLCNGFEMAQYRYIEKVKKELGDELTLILDLDSQVNDQKENSRYKLLYDLFVDEKVSVTQTLLDGMKRQIEGLTEEELKGRKLDTLSTDWITKTNA